MTDSDDRPRSPLGQAIDLCVMAPLGFAAEARTLVPELVTKGRGQVATARVVGRFALDQAGGLLSQAPGRALGALCSLRGGPGQAAPTDADADAASPAPAPAAPSPPPAHAEPAGDAAALAIPDYDSLSASQVVPRLESLEGDELEAVRRYEAGTRARRTILSRIDQLQDRSS